MGSKQAQKNLCNGIDKLIETILKKKSAISVRSLKTQHQTDKELFTV